MNKKVKTEWIFAVSAFVIPFLTMMVVLILQKSIPFGNASFLMGDAYNQYYAIFGEMIEQFRGGNLGSMLWERGMGADFAANLLYYGISPFNVLILIFGKKHLDAVMTIIILLKMACIGGSSYYFFMHSERFIETEENHKLRPLFSLGAANAFALCGYVLAYNNNLIWLDGIILLPLLGLAIERLVHHKKGFLYVLFLTLAIFSNFYFSVYLCLFAFLYFFMVRFENLKEFWEGLFRMAIYSILAILLSCVVLVPAFYGITHVGVYDNSFAYQLIPNWGEWWSFLEAFNPGSELDTLGNSIYTYNLYCGCLVILLPVVFVMQKCEKRNYKIRQLFIVGFLAVAMNCKALNFVLHGFRYPHGMGNRFSFLLIFFLVCIAFQTLSAMETMKRKELVMMAVALVLLCIGMITLPSSSYAFFIICGLIYFITAFDFVRNKMKRAKFLRIWIILWIVELSVNAVFVSKGKKMPESFESKIHWDQIQNTYDTLALNPGERKTFLSKSSYMLGSQTDWYSSVINGSLVNSFQSLGLSIYEGAEATYRGTTPLSAFLFNVRYIGTNEVGVQGGYHPAEMDKPYIVVSDSFSDYYLSIYEADYLGGFGFMMDEGVLDWQGTKDVGSNQNELLSLAVPEVNGKKLFTASEAKLIAEATMLMDAVKRDTQEYEYESIVVFPPYLLLNYEAQKEEDLYLWSKDTGYRTVEADVNGEGRVYTSYTDNASFVHIGKVKPGDKITVKLVSGVGKGEKGILSYRLYAYHEEVFREAIPYLQDEPLQITSFTNKGILGEIDAKQKGILYLALPYSEGFHIRVDKNMVNPQKIGTGLMGVLIEEGKHDIEISYRTPGLKLGAELSAIGLVLGALLFAYKRLRIRGQKREIA